MGRSPCVAHSRETGRVGVAHFAYPTTNPLPHLPLAGRSARAFARRVGAASVPRERNSTPMRRLLFQGLTHRALTEAPPKPDDTALNELAALVDTAARRRLGCSLAIREIDAGSCNGCELEIHAL